MARIEVDKLVKVEKTNRLHDIVRATYALSHLDETNDIFQIDTYSGPDLGHLTQSFQLDTDNVGKLIKLLSSLFESFVIPLLDDKGDVKYGINWGNRSGRNPNQAYLDLPKAIYDSTFFPTNGNCFTVRTDDNQNIKFTRAQKDPVNGHALQTPDDNALLGLYLRNRLSVEPGSVITKEAIEQYGRDHIVISKIGDFYYLDFSSQKQSNVKKIASKNNNSDSLQVIYYGAPGTGKSYKIKAESENLPDDNVIRTTFHPDSDYATFVGSYKPFMEEKDSYALDATGKTHKIDAPKEEKIVYKFIPQAFLQAYCQAWKCHKNGDKVILVIEEINRGNCAQIFGDIFQLLDRSRNGYSAYDIKPDADITQFLQTDPEYKLADLDIEDVMDDEGRLVAKGVKIANGKSLVLPNNLYIYATMNTSDQSLFPIDSAFKRRWDWEYVPIEQPEEGAEGDPRKWKIKADGHWCYWWEFLQAINEEIEDVTHSEDKQLGYFFAKPQDGKYVDAKTFVSKVVFYLWNDVFKDENSEIFRYKELEGKWKVDMPAPKRDNLYFRSFVKGREDVDEKMVRWFVNNLLKEHKVVLLNDSHQTPVTSDDNPKEDEIAWMRRNEDVPPADEDRTEDDMSSINVTDVNFSKDEYKPILEALSEKFAADENVKWRFVQKGFCNALDIQFDNVPYKKAFVEVALNNDKNNSHAQIKIPLPTDSGNRALAVERRDKLRKDVESYINQLVDEDQTNRSLGEINKDQPDDSAKDRGWYLQVNNINFDVAEAENNAEMFYNLMKRVKNDLQDKVENVDR